MKRPRERFYLWLMVPGFALLGYWLRFRAPLPPAVRDASGGVLYVMLWIVLAAALFSKASATRIAAAVTAMTGSLEFLQLWHPAWIEMARATFPGRALLGTTFAWNDFPPYFIGGLAGWLLLSAIRDRTSSTTSSGSTF